MLLVARGCTNIVQCRNTMLVAMQCAAAQVCSFSMTAQVRIFLTTHRSFPWLWTRMHLVYKGQRTSAEEGTKVLHAVGNADRG